MFTLYRKSDRSVTIVAKNLDIVYMIDTYAAVLTEKQREVLELYYYDDLSLAEIAQNSGISRQGVRDSIKRGEAAMLELEDKLGLAKRMRSLGEKLEAIRVNTQEIVIANDMYTYSNEIKHATQNIYAALEQIEND